MEAKSVDFSRSFDGIKEKVLHIHGDADPKVPLESLAVYFRTGSLFRAATTTWSALIGGASGFQGSGIYNRW